MVNDINILRFLAFIRNDIFPYYGAISMSNGEREGDFQMKNALTKKGIFYRRDFHIINQEGR